MKNWIAFCPLIGIALILTINPAGADQHRQYGHRGHFQHNQNRGRRPPWGRPGYYRPQRGWAPHPYGEQYHHPYGNPYGNPYGYYPQPPVVYAPPQPPPGLSFFFGVGPRP